MTFFFKNSSNPQEGRKGRKELKKGGERNPNKKVAISLGKTMC